MVDIAGDRTVDPDAQAAVTDFLDYTEYLPSDLIRSLTLIRGLDEIYHNHTIIIDDLTKQYGSIPSLEPSMRPNVQGLRLKAISTLDAALNARESAFAEASRLFDVADRHQNRLKSIIAKLNAIPKPPSRDPTPQPLTSVQKRSRMGREIKPGSRLTLKPPRGGAVASAILGRPRGRRVTVPGEVLPPYDPDEAIASTEVSDWESPPPSPPRPLLKLKQPKVPKEIEKSVPVERPPRAPREHATYRKPTPPPEDAELGSKYRPWTRLTEFEMYKLRKKMKKNHTWEPSPVMIRRELELRGRGWDNYYRAKAEAQANGIPFVDIEKAGQSSQLTPSTSGHALQSKPEKEQTEATTPIVVATPEPKTRTKKPDPKKDKKPDTAREQAALAAQEAELAARRLGDIGSAFKNLFSPLSNALASLNRSASTPSAATAGPSKKTEKAAKKRKLEEVGVSASPSAESDVQRKKQKIASKPSPLPSLAPSTETPQPSAGTIKIPLKLTVAPQPLDTSESSTPATGTRADSTARSSVAPKTEESTPPPPSQPVSRPVSRKSTAPPPEYTGDPGIDAVPTTVRAASRRTSATPAAASRRTPSLSLRQTPAADSSPRGLPTAASRRPKREVPGTVTRSNEDGGPAVSMSKRKNKPGKQKKAASNTSPEVRVDIDGRAELVDPNEERYCICGDVSYGEMICCELDEKCEFGQWFHMDCVSLAALPARTVKWYCPGDRKKLHKGENTNGLVGRGVK
ncbi:uncharacterized protein HMPREF1541_00354 [Cyphellophora europaea CBS 101466]|uniref:Inhibitor of growth protein N-terminal histone-binding domain-containing protein n=1 Tax=Cyphellophora europaea (strain CBS 101466) TaxID=1220924 RepID=W2SC35_CYPE1|nr:uncharacterized protein HMPREF1541_00354 [Cyphellophora europaea CBS 101466]ETN46170.1 hypothetical protein HMPREF1541_00354 [Cyphellophora europaea CBS 101466]